MPLCREGRRDDAGGRKKKEGGERRSWTKGCGGEGGREEGLRMKPLLAVVAELSFIRSFLPHHHSC